MCMHCYVFLSDDSLLTRPPNIVINCIYNILPQSIITFSSLADTEPGFNINLFQVVRTLEYMNINFINFSCQDVISRYNFKL